jgi:hypothetical protein
MHNIILMRGKKYKKKVRATKKGEKERKDKEKEKKSCKMTEREQCFIKLWETWEKMQALGDIIPYFRPQPILLSRGCVSALLYWLAVCIPPPPPLPG